MDRVALPVARDGAPQRFLIVSGTAAGDTSSSSRFSSSCCCETESNVNEYLATTLARPSVRRNAFADV